MIDSKYFFKIYTENQSQIVQLNMHDHKINCYRHTTNIQNLTINQFCNMHETISTITYTTISISTHSTITTVPFSASKCALFLELKNGQQLFKAEIMPKIMYEVPCQSHQHFSGQIIKYGFHPSIE
jgi:hypothetical protein